MSLTPEQIAKFHEDGFLALDRILTEAQVEKARAAVHRLFRGEYTHDRRPPEYRTPRRVYKEGETVARHTVNGRFLDADLWDISTDPRIAEMAAQLLDTPSLSLMEDQLVEKVPGGAPIAMHQDAPYLTFLRSWDVMNLWISLVDLTIDMSPLLCIRGSHKWPVSAKPKHFADGTDADLMEVVSDACPPGETAEVVPVLVPAGGGAFFGALTMHGSECNRSDKTRYAYTLHYAAETTTADIHRWPANYEPYVVEGIADGGRVTSKFMPIVYPPQR
ncbi:MAG TPA: phytanoyl-CoA dioxygenase family protein [Chthonomonadaceae bacterium]|nr:phytanoyl-CoA dioxygenase family protein [Chthonomonadaceae bacterium]